VGVGTLWLYLGGSSASVGKGVTVMEGGSWADQRGRRWNSSSEMNGMNGDINLNIHKISVGIRDILVQIRIRTSD
jgi:hypothetical protein